MARLSLATLALVALATVLAGVSGATPTPTKAPTEAPGEAGNVSIAEVRAILAESAGSWSQAEAQRIYQVVRRGDLDALPREDVRRLYRRLIARAGRHSPPSAVIDAVAARVANPDALARQVYDSLPAIEQNHVETVLELGSDRLAQIASRLAATPTPTPAATPAVARGRANAVGNTSEVVAQLGRHVQLTGWRFEDGQMHLTFRASLPSIVVVTDALGPVADEGVSQIPQREYRLHQGVTTVSMDVETYRGAAAVSVATDDASIYVSTGITIGNPWAGGSATVGWVGGSLVAILMFVAAGYWVLRQEGNQPRVAGEVE